MARILPVALDISKNQLHGTQCFLKFIDTEGAQRRVNLFARLSATANSYVHYDEKAKRYFLTDAGIAYVRKKASAIARAYYNIPETANVFTIEDLTDNCESAQNEGLDIDIPAHQGGIARILRPKQLGTVEVSAQTYPVMSNFANSLGASMHAAGSKSCFGSLWCSSSGGRGLTAARAENGLKVAKAELHARARSFPDDDLVVQMRFVENHVPSIGGGKAPESPGLAEARLKYVDTFGALRAAYAPDPAPAGAPPARGRAASAEDELLATIPMRREMPRVVDLLHDLTGASKGEHFDERAISLTALKGGEGLYPSAVFTAGSVILDRVTGTAVLKSTFGKAKQALQAGDMPRATKCGLFFKTVCCASDRVAEVAERLGVQLRRD